MGVQGGQGTRGVNSQRLDQPLSFSFTISVMGTSLVFSFHYKSNLSAILPNNSRITAYLICVPVMAAGGGGGSVGCFLAGHSVVLRGWKQSFPPLQIKVCGRSFYKKPNNNWLCSVSSAVDAGQKSSGDDPADNERTKQVNTARSDGVRVDCRPLGTDTVSVAPQLQRD